MDVAAVLAAVADEFAVDPAEVGEHARVLVRLLLAVALGAVLGYDRERRESAAGLRTHMLVALGTALFALAPQAAVFGADPMSRVLQGIVAGIGFLGAGAILKRTAHGEVRGLTTAAGIWATAAIAVACAMGRVWLAIASTLACYVVLALLVRAEARMKEARATADPGKAGPGASTEGSPEPGPVRPAR